MKAKLLIFFLTFCILLIVCKSPPEPTIRMVSYNYFITLPKDYDQQQNNPLILFLHGRGGGTTDYEIYKSYGLGEYAEQNEDFPFVVVAPQSYDEWSPELLDKVLNEVVRAYNIDEKRIYCTGFSLGGYGTYLLAFEYPSRFAAIAPVAGWGIPEKANLIKDLPIWVFHDEGDDIVPYSMAQEMINALEACDGNVKTTIYNNNSHNSWNEAYSNPELYEWFLSYEKP